MANKIFYFTGTGNSLVIARDLARELGDTEVFFIPEIIKKDMDLSADKIGIVFPVYMFGVPLIVLDFIEKLKGVNCNYIFAVINYGGMPAATLKVLENKMEECGLKLNAGFGVMMPGNYTPLYGAPSEKKQKKMFDKWEKSCMDFVAIIKKGLSHKAPKGNIIANWIFTDVLYKSGAKHMREMDKSFWIDSNCIKCGLCKKVCPVDNIELIDSKPTWKHNCEQCFACLQWCPRQAIQSGKNTVRRKRYHHPNVKASDIGIKSV